MSRPIAEYALISDCQSAALVSRNGSVDWWCAPRFDSRSCFARLLDADAGHWAVHPIEDYEVSRAYLPGTMVLRTEFRTATGTVRLTDALDLCGASGHRIGQGSPHVLARRVEGLAGQVNLRMEFCPRLEYGLTVPGLRRVAGSIETVGGPDRLRLFGGQDWDLAPDGRARLDLVVSAGRSYGFVLAHQEGMVRTIDTVERELGVDGLLRRLTGAEDGAFVICSYWLVECLAQAGEVDRARAVFDRVTGHANDVGLLAEQIDVETGELLSNFPQTFSHAGLINAAWAIDRAMAEKEAHQPWASSPTG